MLGGVSQGRARLRASETIALRWSTRSAGDARHRIGAALRQRGLPETFIADAALVVSEMVSNAIRHARPRADGQLRMAWQLDDHHLRLEVTDGGGDTEPSMRAAGADEIGGRGLAMVGAVSLEWGVRRKGRESTVWVLLPVPR